MEGPSRKRARSGCRCCWPDKARPELFASTDERRQIRVHDLCGTFVTTHLASGKSESWIADHTGHKSSQTINRYKRTARLFSKVRAGKLEPLNAAIPGLNHAEIGPLN